MNKKTFPLLLATTMVLGACSTNDEATVEEFDDSNLSRIELGGAGNSEAFTRVGFTVANTTLKLHYVSTRKVYDAETFPYNDGEGKGILYMTSSATASIDNTKTAESVSAVTQTVGPSGQKRYWDDIHGKNSKLAIYSIAVPNKAEITNTTNKTAFNAWDTNIKEGTTTVVANDIAWTVSTTQTLTTIADEDLAYSNNVTGENSLVYSTTNNRFEKANVEDGKSLVFNHALSRITINVKKGDGFGDFTSEFNVSSVKLTGFTTGGTLNVSAGSMSSTANATVETVGTKTDLNDGESKIGYTYVAQVFPNTTIKDNTAKMLTVVVDGNNYPVTGAEIYNSLQENNPSIDDSKISSLNPGTNYNVTLIIKKTGIEIASAKLVDWEEINGTEMIPSNAINLTATMEESAGTQTTIASDIYRSTVLATGYVGNKNTLSSANALGTTWYWPNNSTEYYLRTISPQNITVTTAANDYITMTGGAIADGNDYIWGAPLKETHDATPHSFTYSNGYESYLYPAIGVTKTPIHITQFHMMSKIEVNLSTSDNSLGDAVTLTDATVEILGYYNTATLALSNAAITTTGDKVTSSGAITANTEHTEHTWRVIPQTTTGITFKITADGNVYNVNLPAETGIASWLPGKAYVYNFKLLKTGIQVTSAKLVDWETVTAADKTVTLESKKGFGFWK